MILQDLDFRLRLKNAARRFLGMRVLSARRALAPDALPQLSARHRAVMRQQTYRMLIVCDSRRLARRVLHHFDQIAAEHALSALDASLTPSGHDAHVRVQLHVRCTALQRAGLARFAGDIGNLRGVRHVCWETQPHASSARLH